MANDLLTAKKLVMADAVGNEMQFISGGIRQAGRIWDAVERKNFTTVDVLANYLGSLRDNLQVALNGLDRLEKLAIPLPTGGNGSPLKNVGETDDNDKR